MLKTLETHHPPRTQQFKFRFVTFYYYFIYFPSTINCLVILKFNAFLFLSLRLILNFMSRLSANQNACLLLAGVGKHRWAIVPFFSRRAEPIGRTLVALNCCGSRGAAQ